MRRTLRKLAALAFAPNDGNRFSLVDDDMRQLLSADLLNACLGK